MRNEANEKPINAIVAAVQLPNVSDIEFESSLAELRDLAKTLGFEIVATFTQKRSSFDSTAYLGAGKREEIREFVDMEPAPGAFEKPLHAAADPAAGKIDAIFVDHEISPSQARNLEKETGCEVMDRTMVILEIFHRHATSRAARAQVTFACRRTGAVHRRGLRFAGEPHEALTASPPHALRLDARGDTRQGGGIERRHAHDCSVLLGAAITAMRSHNSGNGIPAAAAAWGMRLNSVRPGLVLASRQ